MSRPQAQAGGCSEKDIIRGIYLWGLRRRLQIPHGEQSSPASLLEPPPLQASSGLGARAPASQANLPLVWFEQHASAFACARGVRSLARPTFAASQPASQPTSQPSCLPSVCDKSRFPFSSWLLISLNLKIEEILLLVIEIPKYYAHLAVHFCSYLWPRAQLPPAQSIDLAALY